MQFQYTHRNLRKNLIHIDDKLKEIEEKCIIKNTLNIVEYTQMNIKYEEGEDVD